MGARLPGTASVEPAASVTGWLAVVLAGSAAAVLVSRRPGAGRLAGLGAATERSRGGAAPSRLRGLPVPVLAGAMVLVTLGPVAAAVAVAGAQLGATSWRGRRTDAATRSERAGAIEALTALAGDLRAGRSPAEALAEASTIGTGGVRQALTGAAAAARLGGDVPGALLSVASAAPDVLRGLAACWSVCSVAGSGLATGVDRLAAGLRTAEAQRVRLDAELAGPRATAALLAGLPLAGLLMAGALGADPLRVLLHTPLGVTCLVAGLALDLLGLAWTRRMVAAVAPEPSASSC